MSAGPFVLTVANDKRGVGKTTTTANLACAFAKRFARPVLVIDLDPQGTLSELMFAGSNWRPPEGQRSAASIAIDGKCLPESLVGAATLARPFTWKDSRGQTSQTAAAFGLAAFYDLTETENRAVVGWVLGDRLRDIRYELFKLLRDPIVRNHFAMILIDAPPRFSISSIQALCAGTHVLIPTILDNNSAIAVNYFTKQLRRHEALWPHLKVVGILGTMVQDQGHEQAALRTATDSLTEALRGTKAELKRLIGLNVPIALPYEMGIRDRAYVGRTGETGIAYACLGDNPEGRQVRQMFDDVAEELEKRMHR